MACDGHVHDDEFAEFTTIAGQAPYFHGIDARAELEAVVTELDTNGSAVVREYLADLASKDLSVTQQLLLVEMLLRIAHADAIQHPNEIVFLDLVRQILQVPEPLLKQRFGSDPLLGRVLAEQAVREPLGNREWFENLNWPREDMSSVTPGQR